ncbi:hypothetical protein [Methanothrix sp.]|uniref:hypothetical protein n=1 Tax=Methanothrix sp. TaxID=90426 RepID=UPI0025ECDFED|nr:hypothetical protein [Methanothrix sp.]
MLSAFPAGNLNGYIALGLEEEDIGEGPTVKATLVIKRMNIPQSEPPVKLPAGFDSLEPNSKLWHGQDSYSHPLRLWWRPASTTNCCRDGHLCPALCPI